MMQSDLQTKFVWYSLHEMGKTVCVPNREKSVKMCDTSTTQNYHYHMQKFAFEVGIKRGRTDP